jgi:hypothetical protein
MLANTSADDGIGQAFPPAAYGLSEFHYLGGYSISRLRIPSAPFNNFIKHGDKIIIRHTGVYMDHTRIIEFYFIIIAIYDIFKIFG